MSVNPKGLLGTGGLEEVVARGTALVGTPDDAVAFLERYWQKTGGFGTVLLMSVNWAPFEACKASHELFMRYVMPRFSGQTDTQTESFARLKANTPRFSAAAMAASAKATKKRLGPDDKP